MLGAVTAPGTGYTSGAGGQPLLQGKKEAIPRPPTGKEDLKDIVVTQQRHLWLRAVILRAGP